MRRFSRPGLLALAALGLFAGSRSARAWPYYVEFGGSMASVGSPAPLLLSQGKTGTEISSAYAVPFTVGVHLQERQRGLLFHLGLQSRYISGNNDAGSEFTIVPTGPVLRMEFWRFVVGAGYTLWAWNDLAFAKNVHVESVLTLEGQFLMPITPEIDFGLHAARTAFTLSAGSSTVMEYGAFFRLNFGFSESARNERRKFKGWRYPFGSPLR